MGSPTNTAYGVNAHANQFYGGFGFEYAQPVPNGGVIVDQYGLLRATPYVESAAAAPAASLPVVTARPRAQTRVSRSTYGAPLPARYQLPTGSLGWTAGNGGILYSPGMRYQSYGSGYGHGPYGVTDYGAMWKGFPAGY